MHAGFASNTFFVPASNSSCFATISLREHRIEPWLRQEYWRTLSKHLAIAKRRKRSADAYDDELAQDADDAGIDEESDEENEIDQQDDVPVNEQKTDDEQPEKLPTPASARDQPDDDMGVLSDDYLFAMKEDDDELARDNGDFVDEEPAAKRKRSVPSSAADDEYGGFFDIDSKLKGIEEVLLTEALDIISSENTGRGNPANDAKIANRYGAASDLESIRVALNDLRDKTERLENEERAVEPAAIGTSGA